MVWQPVISNAGPHLEIEIKKEVLPFFCFMKNAFYFQ